MAHSTPRCGTAGLNMRVTIEHREQPAGLLGNHKDCYIDCSVEFSEEERAIIKARDLYNEGFTIRTSTPQVTKSRLLGSGLLRIVGRLMWIGGILRGLYESFGHIPTNIGAPLFFLGIALEIWAFIRQRGEDKRIENPEQEITIKQLLAKPGFTVHTLNAAVSKIFEDEIREELTGLKNLIKNSAQLQAKQTFEL
jgi:hypothetical protein